MAQMLPDYIQSPLQHDCVTLSAYQLHLRNAPFPSANGPGGTGFWVPESTPAGFCIFLSDPDPDPESKICENRTRIRSHFSISAVAGVCVVIS